MFDARMDANDLTNSKWRLYPGRFCFMSVQQEEVGTRHLYIQHNWKCFTCHWIKLEPDEYRIRCGAGQGGLQSLKYSLNISDESAFAVMETLRLGKEFLQIGKEESVI